MKRKDIQLRRLLDVTEKQEKSKSHDSNLQELFLHVRCTFLRFNEWGCSNSLILTINTMQNVSTAQNLLSDLETLNGESVSSGAGSIALSQYKKRISELQEREKKRVRIHCGANLFSVHLYECTISFTVEPLPSFPCRRMLIKK